MNNLRPLNLFRVSFDFNDVLSTPKGIEIFKRRKSEGALIYIISGQSNQGFLERKAEEIGIDKRRVFATGSNKRKIEKILELKIDKHYDNNQDVINQLPGIGIKF